MPQKLEEGPNRVLVVDDEVAICDVLAAMLRHYGYQVVTETDPSRVMDLLRDGDFDILLLDLVMPGMDGLELIEKIRRHTTTLPILVVTGYGGADTTVEAMRRGATDFVTKPVDSSFLELRMRRAFDLEHARRLANTDGLTGLYNHRHLQERLQQEIDRAQRYGRPLSVVMADLDRFKRFNDAHGHPRGDEVLIRVAQTLRQVSRAADIVARYGGEELTLILPETPAAEAGVLAERARQRVEAMAIGEGEARVTLSLGVAAFAPGMSKEALIEAADAALYSAKHRGRNRVCSVAEVGGGRSAADPDARAEALAFT
jgi:two-component system cell cycle response regulator